ncbi:hypothetical protein BJ138DRAFT_500284 [Hygrophoropsis aurantiaca]|uniref:Uncharacterized protein n=1 Tax=Hygrophoropsis aurantiaca TaxID=72124 RepID=A0ACB8A2P5_9AGAM|nr:hypothetical protein BJ138DRAFT_500284 [Hygrophoropsis aurantiaca]
MQTPEVLDSFTPIPQRIFKPRVSEPIDQQGILSPRCPKRVSSQSCDRPVTRLEMVLEASDEDFSAGLEHASRESQDHSESDRQQDEAEANVISRNPMSLWESLDMELGSASSIHSQGTPDRQESPFLLLRKLRKSKSALSRHHGLSTLTVSSTTPSAQASNKLRKKMRSASSPMLRVPGSQISNDLPNGVQQIGGGIGYSPIIAPPARPRSIYRTALRSCQSLFFTGLPTLRHKLSMRSMRVSPESSEPEIPAEIEHNHNTMTIMQGIYGNSWTIGMPATIPVALDNVTSPSNDSEGPLTPDSIPFKPPVGITMDDGGSTDLQLVSSSGLRLHM